MGKVQNGIRLRKVAWVEVCMAQGEIGFYGVEWGGVARGMANQP